MEKIPMKGTDFRYARAFLRLAMAAAALLCTIRVVPTVTSCAGQEQLRVADVIMKWIDERVEDGLRRDDQ
jgi:hypothetical protein